ncbi:hypothetical protein [Nocardioides sp. CFH 31398]|uniref:hypothetical protein n=1 Tax=Nocardioides sp. CFH 31398 TaxID=2919579 RepID=UPI001F05FD0A|nr:hypothetical protein [Nocardioides sp. CFH 31398]MCH1867132.1 hypothetical protein [Nocardioides sp. CFH 31398]
MARSTRTSAPAERHRRAEVLRRVMAAADRRRDAVLPTDVPGVPETFTDDLDLLGALQLRWYTRLASRVEAEQGRTPGDLAGAVKRAWVGVADEMPGVRAVLDLGRLRSDDERLSTALRRATAKEHLLLAASAGWCGPHDLARGAALGERLEEAARRRWSGPQAAPRAPHVDEGRTAALLGRLRSLLPA